MSTHSPLIIAHRGASAYLPENTLEAFRLAIEKFNVDMIEFDVQMTKDGVPVIIHDAKLERTTNGRGYVSQRSYQELQHLDAGYYFDPDEKEKFPQRGKGIKIPTLEEVLTSFPRQSLAVEIKQKSVELTHAVIHLLKKHHAEEHAIVGSKHDLIAKIMRNRYPHIRRFCSIRNVLSMYLHFRRHRHKIVKDPMAVASMPMQFLKVHLDTSPWIDYLHAKEMKVYFWAFMNPASIPALKKKGADGLVVNDPTMVN